ncbi:MAG TPA: hypothetical protein VGY53_03350, partial [Isosphaeraceae bacterium]|nr:hypothetical protein [Isosphaeraceae bacterium]
RLKESLNLEAQARMLDLAFILILTCCSAGAGLRLVRWLGQTPDHPADALALAVPLGLGALGLAALGLGEAGMLTAPALSGLLAIGACLGGRGVFGAIHSCWRPGQKSDSTEYDKRSLIGFAFNLAVALTVLGTLLTALAPVTDGDALCYHLEVPKRLLAAHGVLFDPDLHETVYPLLTEMLYAVALAFRGPVACRLVQWVLGLAFAANVTALARPVLGVQARWAGAIALLVPAVSNGMGAPLNDVALAAFGNAALVAWMRWNDHPGRRAAALAGLLSGMALGVKYPALVLAGLLGMVMFVMALQTFLKKGHASDANERLVHVFLFALLAVLAGGSWYLRAWVYTGNPVYPYFRHTFGGAGFDAVLDPTRRAMPVTFWNLITALGSMTLHPGRFESFSHQLGPAFLLFLPALLWMRPPKRVWLLVGLGMVFFTLCLTHRQSMRFVITALGPLSVGVAWLGCTWRERPSLPARVLVGLLVVVLGFEASLAIIRARHGLGVVLGRESAEAYLTRREPTYRVARWVGEHLPANAKLIGQDHRAFYFPRPYTMELAHRRRTGLATRGESPEEIVDRLREEGFTHLLLCPPAPEKATEFDPTLSRRLDTWLAEQRPLYHAEIADPDGVTRRYAIYAIGERPAEPRVAQGPERAGVAR